MRKIGRRKRKRRPWERNSGVENWVLRDLLRVKDREEEEEADYCAKEEERETLLESERGSRGSR